MNPSHLPASPAATAARSHTAATSRSHAGGPPRTGGPRTGAAEAGRTTSKCISIAAATARKVTASYPVGSSSCSTCRAVAYTCTPCTIAASNPRSPITDSRTTTPIAGQVAALAANLLACVRLPVSNRISSGRASKTVRCPLIPIWGSATMLWVVLPVTATGRKLRRTIGTANSSRTAYPTWTAYAARPTNSAGTAYSADTTSPSDPSRSACTTNATNSAHASNTSDATCSPATW